MKVIGIMSSKGGVGKTATSIFLAAYCTRVLKKSACLIDLDFLGEGLSELFPRSPRLEDLLLHKGKGLRGKAKEIIRAADCGEGLYIVQSGGSLEVKGLLADEPTYGQIRDRLPYIIQQTEELGIDVVIFDCGTGDWISQTVLKLSDHHIFLYGGSKIASRGFEVAALVQEITDSLKGKS